MDKINLRDLFLTGAVTLFKWHNKEGWPVDAVTPNVELMVGRPVDDFSSEKINYADLIHPGDVERVKNELEAACSRGMMSIDHEPYRLMRPDGSFVWVIDHTAMICNGDGDITHFVGYILDITDRKLAKHALQQQLKFSHALNRIAECIVSKDDASIILKDVIAIVGETLAVDRVAILDVLIGTRAIMLGCWNNLSAPSFGSWIATTSLDGYSLSVPEMNHTRSIIISHHDAVNPLLTQEGSGQHLHGRRNVKSLLWYPFDFNEAGYRLLVVNHIASKREWMDEEVDFLSSVSKQITIMLTRRRLMTDMEKNRERIQYLAHYDVLTGLPNRAHLEERLRSGLSWAKRNDGNLVLMFLDLDHFKEINDTLGHGAGDALLTQLSHRLRNAVREEDTVARMGGDEFVVVLPGIGEAGAGQVAQKLLDVIAQPYYIEDQSLSVTSSIGIAIYPFDGDDVETLSKNADLAMYRVKKTGRHGYCFFTQEMQEHTARNLQLLNELRYALKRHEFELYYQPQAVVAGGQIVGAEALLRWWHPQLGDVSPVEFIPLAENSGLIRPIGEWVLRTAIHQNKIWHNAGLGDLRIAVNLSAVQLRDPGFPDLVTSILAEAGLSPDFLELELTEGAAMHDPQRAIAIINELNQRGIRISIDDFGTGHSSFSYLKRFNICKLKIDKSFVQDIVDGASDRAILDAIVGMAHSMGIQAIAEGVETETQMEMLRANGCDKVQGFYFSKPLSASDFEKLLRKGIKREDIAIVHTEN